MSASDPLLSIEDLSVRFEDESALMEVIPSRVKERFDLGKPPLRAVDDVSLTVEEDEVVALVGESGSGKTTLGKTAVGLQRPSEGSVNYRGSDFWQLKEQTRIDDLYFEDARKALQIVHQDPDASLNPYRTLQGILSDPLKRWYPEMSHADRRERIVTLFDEIGLIPPSEYLDRYPHELSGGEKQRVTLVRAMLAEPDLILADEPVSALDTSLRVELMDLMLELKEQFETSFLFVSHNLANAQYIAGKADGRIAVMYLGEIVEIGPVEEVLKRPKHPYTKILKWATLPAHPDKAHAALEADSPLRRSDAPDLTNPPTGCRFHTRCPKAKTTCVDQYPELLSTEDPADADEHRVACFRERPDHEYWDAEFIDEDGELPIPE